MYKQNPMHVIGAQPLPAGAERLIFIHMPTGGTLEVKTAETTQQMAARMNAANARIIVTVLDEYNIRREDRILSDRQCAAVVMCLPCVVAVSIISCDPCAVYSFCPR